MTLEHPYFIFIHLYDDIRDSNGVTNRWIFIDGEDGTVSGQTDNTNGECAIDISRATSTDGDILTIYDGTFISECKLDITTPATLLDLYQNASNSDDITIQYFTILVKSQSPDLLIDGIIISICEKERNSHSNKNALLLSILNPEMVLKTH